MLFEKEITYMLILTGLDYARLLAGKVAEDATNGGWVKMSEEGKTEFADNGFLYIEEAVIERLGKSRKEELILEDCRIIIRLV